MKYSVAILALAAAVSAQSFGDVPKCAIPCLEEGIVSETSCDKTDMACVCKNFEKIQGSATSCVLKDCGADVALNEVLPAVEKLCANPPTEEPTEKPTEKPTEEPTEEPTEAPTEKPTEEPVETPSVTVVPTPIPTNGTGPAPTEEPAPVPTAGAAAYGPMGAVALGALVLAL